MAVSIIELFPSVFAFLIFYILWLVWFFFEMIFSWTTPFIRSKGKIVFEDMGSTVLIIVSSLACFVFVIYISVNEISLLSPWFTYLGLAIFLSGMLFRFWAILVLGRYFSPIVGLYKNHTVITSGPYRLVRHPSYTGALVMLFGYAVILRSWIGAVVMLAVMLPVYLYRIRVEEDVLKKRFSNEYLKYAKGKKKIMPFII